MAGLLYRLGRFSARRPWTVITTWLLIFALAATAYLLGRGDMTAGFDIPGTETARVTAAMQDQIPDLSGDSGHVVFYTADGSPITSEQQQAIGELAETTRDLPYVATVVDPFAAEQEREAHQRQIIDGRPQLEQAESQIPPGDQFDAARQELQEQRRMLELGEELLTLAQDVRLVSADGSAALMTVSFTESRLTMPDSAKTALVDHLRAHPVDGVQMDLSAEIAQTVPDLMGPAEVVGVAVAAIVLAVMLGTFVAAGLPIVTALAGLGVGALATLSLSGVIQIASVTPVLGVMLGLAVGIDYSLFILNRHRRQLAQGMARAESIGLANGTAGNAVVFAGSTVLVALLALNVTGIPFLGLMGTVGAVCVAVAVLVAVTLAPALLQLAGDRVVSRRLRRSVAAQAESRPPAPMSHLRAIVGVVVGAAALLVLAVPAMSMRLGLPDGSAEAQDSTQYRAYQVIAEEFGEGRNGPLLVTADGPTPTSMSEGLALQVSIGQLLAAQPDVAAVAPAATSPDGSFMAFQVIPTDGPTSATTEALVRNLRTLSPLPDGTELGVAGQTTGNIDISDKLADALPTYLILVVGLSALIMLIVFRSIVVPVIATAGFILSLAATFGALVAIYQWGWLGAIFGVHDPGPLLNFLPVVLVGVLFGLAMDYQLFLASGMREAWAHGTSARAAVVAGLRNGRAVVTAAAIIMISVFSGFVFSETVMVRPIGFGLAFGVLVDAFIVRMVIIPALLHLVGPGAWWLPRWLQRLLPPVDIEGAALQRSFDLSSATATELETQPREAVYSAEKSSR